MPRYDLAVWSEIETGDWESCVAASYLTGLVYGGVVDYPLGVYTQAEREALEAVKDEPQDYATTDRMAAARYGVQLRRLSTGSIDDAVTRVGVGLVLTGYGGFLIPTNATIHSVFYLPTSPTTGLLFDPLAPNQSAGVAVSAAQAIAWSAGRAGPEQVREVRDSEFLPDEGTDAMNLKGTPIEPLNNRMTRITNPTGAGFAEDCTAMPYNNLAILAVNVPFTVDWRVRGNTLAGTDEWFAGWITADPAGGRPTPQFGYVISSQCGPLEPIEVAEPGEPTEPGDDAAELEAWRQWFATRPVSANEDWVDRAPE